MAPQTTSAETNNILFAIILLLPILLVILKLLKPSPSLPPGPYPWQILGKLLQLVTTPHQALTQISKLCGPLFSVKVGNQVIVVGSSREAAMEILKTQDRVLSGRQISNAALPVILKLKDLPFGLMAECNDEWKFWRTVCRTEIFSGKALESQAGARDKMAMQMLKYINKMEGKEVNIREVAFAALFNLFGNVLVSRDFRSFENESFEGEICEPIREIVKLSQSVNISDFIPILARLDLQGSQKRTRECYQKICKAWESIINERREIIGRGTVPSQRDFLDALIANGSTNDHINLMLLDMFIAGSDSSSVTIEWLMAELIKNPESMKKVKQEIETVTNGEAVRHYHLPQLKYLEACFKETLRLHPPAPILFPHRAVESCKVMNFDIPKNALIIVNIWEICRDPKIWEQPLVFKPERFLKSNSSFDFKGKDFEFIPFGSGRRICPGLPLAATNVPLIVALLFQFFDWSLPNGEDPAQLDMTEKKAATVIKEQALLLIPNAKN